MIDLSSDSFRLNPYPSYEALRKLGRSYYDKESKTWFFGHFSDVDQILRDSKVFTSRPASVESSLNGADGLLHRSVREVAQKAFSSSRLTALDDKIIEVAESCIRDIEPGQEMNFVSSVGSVVPGAVLSWMIGNSEATPEHFRKWVSALVRLHGVKRLSREKRKQTAFSSFLTSLNLRKQDPDEAAVYECFDFVRTHVDSSLKSGATGWFTEIVLDAYKDEKIKAENVADVMLLMIIAAYETTTSLLGMTAIFLSRNPEYQSALRQSPEKLPNFIEEMLRWESPVQRRPRITSVDTEMAGISLPADTLIIGLIGSANHDPEEFTDPSFNMDREKNRHLSFGSGPHYCLGAQLARMESHHVLDSYLKSGLQLSVIKDQAIDHPKNLSIRGPRALKVVFT